MRISVELGSLLSLALNLDDAGNGVGELGAILDPESNALGVVGQALGTLGNHRVVEAKTLVEAAVAAIAGIGGNDVVEGTLLGAGTGKADNDHFFLF